MGELTEKTHHINEFRNGNDLVILPLFYLAYTIDFSKLPLSYHNFNKFDV